jgi:hypothetical protein
MMMKRVQRGDLIKGGVKMSVYMNVVISNYLQYLPRLSGEVVVVLSKTTAMLHAS